MDYLTFRSAFTSLLTLHNHTASVADILHAMEAPYLFLSRDDRYIAGTGFFTPKWLHLYLRPLGLQLTPHSLERSSLSTFLHKNTPTILHLPEDKYLLITACKDQCVCLAQPSSAKVQERSLTLATLRRYLPETLMAYTLDVCVPEPVDFLPLLMESVHTLSAYEKDVLPLLSRTVSREDMPELHSRCFRPLMVELPRLAQHYDDAICEALMMLHHAYRHLFTIGEDRILLQERLSRKRILLCLAWLKETIIDRLYELGASDEQLEQCYSAHDQPQ